MRASQRDVADSFAGASAIRRQKREAPDAVAKQRNLLMTMGRAAWDYNSTKRVMFDWIATSTLVDATVVFGVQAVAGGEISTESCYGGLVSRASGRRRRSGGI